MKYMNVVRKYGRNVALALPAPLLLIGGNAMAAATDFSSITSGLDVSTCISAILAAALLVAGVVFAIWGAKKVAGFFGR